MNRVRQRGFSLVEVVVALGLLAAVLISISGLFVLAHRQVDGGRKHSVALSVARDILEEMDGWSFRQIYLEYGLDGSAASYTIDSRTNGAAAGWQDALAAELSECHAEILLQSLDGSGSPPALVDTRAVRVEVGIFWKEGLRPRSLRLAVARM
jgi:prepilin-type N-terminal cleavage/methylation domain-containing protein